MKNKYLVSIEFRFYDYIEEVRCKSKKLTIGVYDCFENACLNGNNVLEIMECKFELHEFPNGIKANKERFSKKNMLITNLAYLKTPFQFYIKITELKYNQIDNVINEVLESVERYRNNKNNIED